METHDHFPQRTGDTHAVLLKAPERHDKALATTKHEKFCWELTLYTNYMETEHATVHLLKEVFPNSIVGPEAMFG